MRHIVFILGFLTLTACDKSMTQQKRYRADAPSSLWSDGSSARRLPEHTVAQSDTVREDQASRPPMTAALVARGRERYEIYCSPCHGLDGRGRGMVVERGFPQPPSYLEPRLVGAPGEHFYDVITKGYGVMFSYASRVSPRDRWAIVAYVRALQLSQHASLTQAPDAGERTR
jgi:mono/diheme cytochrome c family protein